MKRLLAAGAPAIYQITKAFRHGEAGPWHNPEFTMVEWYRPGDTLAAGMQLLSDVGQILFDCPAADQMTYREVFQTALRLDPHAATVEQLRRAAQERHADSWSSQPSGARPLDRDGWLDWLWGDQIQPQLGQERPLIVHDYPASQAALAQLRDSKPPVAERFEMFYHGVELANGYHELQDADQLRARNQIANVQRQAAGEPPLPSDSRLLAAMQHGLPDCCGVALGFDRAVMVVAGATSISQVMPFPWATA
jgi:lysyl-tRNA synthetase class 2